MTGSNLAEFRCVKLLDAMPRVLQPPLELWRMPRARYARFDFDGLDALIPSTFTWLLGTWLPTSLFRRGFAPTITLFDKAAWAQSSYERSLARIYLPLA